MPFVVVEIKEIEAANDSGLQVLKVETRENQSKEEWTQIVTNAKNVKIGMRTVIATEGTIVDDQEVKATAIGGKKSFGMLCDQKMLGWGSTNVGLAVSIAKEGYALGSEAPSSNPNQHANQQEENPFDPAVIKAKKEAEKAAKKAAAKEKRAQRAASKNTTD